MVVSTIASTSSTLLEKKMKRTFLPIIAFLLLSSLAHADLFMEQAQHAVDMFNSMNKNQGYVFTQKVDSNSASTTLGKNVIMTTTSGKDLVDLDAYTASYAAGVNDNGNQFFKTFCVEPGVGTAGMVRGKLDYTNGTSTTAKGGDNLSLGTAALYAQYVSGTLDGYVDLVTTEQLVHAIRAAMETSTYGDYYTSYDWETNIFLAALLGINADKDYWTQDYDPGKYYEEVGDYSVFVMNTYNGDGFNVQNMLYIVENDGHASSTPEPASILIVGIGLASALPMIRRRKNKAVQ